MKISKQMLDNYIGYITGWYITKHNEPADELTDYYDLVLEIKANALMYQDLEPLRLGINYLRCHPEIDVKKYGNGIYPWDDEEVREILDYIYSVIWSDDTKLDCDEVKDIQLVDMSKYDWWKMRGVKP